MLSSSEVRKQFVEFFCKKHGHKNIASSPVVPLGDPTLLFANAGMNQFKPYFLGTEKPPVPRVANTQKCIRAGGKHNDLDDVGKDTYHHTFFEMLGNWSFGDYFKKEAIAWAWELLTDVWKIDPTRLHVTVFEGDPGANIPKDDEAAGFWKDAGVPPERIHLGNKKDNFWEMGNTGPCGPCTEIHYDSTPDRSGGPLVNQSSDQVIEIWNLVFIQFNRNEDQSLTPLPAKHVDTGMGFERITKVIQGKDSNYDTDVFQPIFAAIEKVTKSDPYTGILDNLKDTAYRVIADHIRTLTFALTDGARFGNEGRDYVLRRILRRAERYGKQHLGTKEPFLHKIVEVVVVTMGDAFPELRKDPTAVIMSIHDEELAFLKNYDRAMVLFEKAKKKASRQFELARLVLPGNPAHQVEPWSDEVRAHNEKYTRDKWPRPVISDEDAFKLHDTYGFFIDLTEQLASEKGILVDRDGFERLLEEARSKSRQGAKTFAVTAVKGELPPTDDSPKYAAELIDATVLGWVIDNEVVRTGSLKAGDEAALLLDRTLFYAEQGGQVGDTGIIDKPETDGVEFEVTDTQRLGNTVLHIGTLHDGELKAGDRVNLQQGTMRRIDVMRNHTATHLLNLALKQVLGQHVEQKGSLVDDAKTRFDFSHDKPIGIEQLQEIERRVNRGVIQDHIVTAVEMPLEEAKKLPGVRAVFGEKYPDPVRVVMIGADQPSKVTADLSVEFCGGTHMPRTGLIGYFKITGQEAVAKGVRRITAVTGRPAYQEVQSRSALVDDLSTRFQCRPDELPSRVEALQDQVKVLQDQLKKGAAAGVASAVDALLESAATVGETKFVIGQLPPNTDIDAVRAQIERIRQKCGSAFVAFGWTEDGGKVPLVVALTSDLVKKGLKAGDVVKQAAALIGGSGGGKPDYAQAGGKDASRLPDALKKAEELGREKIK